MFKKCISSSTSVDGETTSVVQMSYLNNAPKSYLKF